MQNQTHITDTTTKTAGWASGSLAVIIPVGGVRADPADGTENDRAADYPWDLSGLRRRSKTQPLSSPNKVTWDLLRDQNLVRATTPTTYSRYIEINVGQGRHCPDVRPVLETAGWDMDELDKRGITISAIEVFGFTSGVYVTLHVELTAEALRDPAAAAGYFAFPTPRGHEGHVTETQARARLSRHALEDLVTALNIPSCDGDDQRISHPFVVTHLIPHEEFLPKCDLLGYSSARRGGWTDEQVWGVRLATASNLSATREPGFCSPVDGYWLGSTWCYPAAHGLAMIATRGIHEIPVAPSLPTASSDEEEQRRPEGAVWWLTTGGEGFRDVYVEHVALDGFAHRHAVDFALLAMRQTEFLRTHSFELSGIWDELQQTEETDGLARKLEKTIKLQESFLRFRNQIWFTTVPEDPGITKMLNGLQKVFGVAALFGDIDSEQEEIARAFALAETRQRQQEQFRQEERDRSQAERDHKVQRAVSQLAAALVIPGLVFSLFEVGGELGWVGVIAAVLVAVGLGVTSYRILARHLNVDG